MKRWIKNRKNRLAVLLVGTQILLIVFLIAPAHDKFFYYEEKKESSLREAEKLRKYSFYQERRRQKFSDVRQKLESLKNQTPQNINAVYLQNQLKAARLKLNLAVIAQKIEDRDSRELYDKVIVRQTLKGKYDDQMKYIASLSSSTPLMLLSECSYESLDPLSVDPDLLADLEFIYLIPKD